MASTRLTQRQEIQFFASLHKADVPLGVAWWAILVLRGVLPTAFAISTACSSAPSNTIRR